MRMLSVDQSTTKTGYALFADGDLRAYGVIASKSKDPLERMRDMCSQIQSLIKKYKPSLLVIEKVSLHSSVPTLVSLANLQGAIFQMCYEKDIAYILYAPSTWRRIIGILGGKLKREDYKKRAIAFVENSYGVTVSDDCAEAICMGLAHLIDTGVIQPQGELNE